MRKEPEDLLGSGSHDTAGDAAGRAGELVKLVKVKLTSDPSGDGVG